MTIRDVIVIKHAATQPGTRTAYSLARCSHTSLPVKPEAPHTTTRYGLIAAFVAVLVAMVDCSRKENSHCAKRVHTEVPAELGQAWIGAWSLGFRSEHGREDHIIPQQRLAVCYIVVSFVKPNGFATAGKHER